MRRALVIWLKFATKSDVGEILQRLATIDRKLDALHTQGARLMSAVDDLNAKLDRVDTATNNIAADIRAIKDSISTGMSAADVAAVSARLEASAGKLEALDAENPDGQVPTP